jgi:hypothetical protein
MTLGKREAAKSINAYFISKVDFLRAAGESPASDAVDSATNACVPTAGLDDVATPVPDSATDAHDSTAGPADSATALPNPAAEVIGKARDLADKPSLAFAFATAGKIAKIIRGLKATEAMGIDDIPTSELKKGVEVLAGPISHLVNRSLAEGRVPEAFKVGKVFPIFKGKACEDPASYRLVSILPAMSKILEKSVKADLEEHLARVNGLPGAQYGFWPMRSCTTALAHTQAGWLTGAERGQVVGIMAFDLSAAFDTVAADRLLPKLQSLRRVWEGSRLVQVILDRRQPASILGRDSKRPHCGSVWRKAGEHPGPDSFPDPHQRHGQRAGDWR